MVGFLLFEVCVLTAKTMFVRTEGGDVIRREVVVSGLRLTPGASELVKQPKLHEGESLKWLEDDIMPTIIKRHGSV
ncbi:hypothetical protein KDL21_01270 [Pseudomonas syringae pv. syringae]|uniref:hypothetical protein n=1 Tax=Pseudomonas syringae TaxID=317 RepID=UPI00233F8DB5|nr:hypothetical protein [Pseudomonas syringae]MDC3739651.1 hypothetical protein [Pseudomonas syringae pv. syringae]